MYFIFFLAAFSIINHLFNYVVCKLSRRVFYTTLLNKKINTFSFRFSIIRIECETYFLLFLKILFSLFVFLALPTSISKEQKKNSLTSLTEQKKNKKKITGKIYCWHLRQLGMSWNYIKIDIRINKKKICSDSV